MNDYSKFMKDKDSFVTGYTCTDNKILATFSSLGKNKPIVYDLDQAGYDTFEERLEDQYQAVIAAKKKIIQGGYSKTSLALVCGSVIGVALGVGSGILYPEMLELAGAFIATGAISFASYLAINKASKRKSSEIDLCADYLLVKDELERAYDNDPNKNVTRYVSEKTSEVIASQEEITEELREKGISATTFNISMMDRLSDIGELKDMRDMLLVIKAMKGLKKPVGLDSSIASGAHSKDDSSLKNDEEEFDIKSSHYTRKIKK